MAKPLLILLHGMGTSAEGWADPYLQRLEEIAATFPGISNHGSLADQVTIKPLVYDSVFRGRIKGWEDEGSKIDAFKKELGGSLPKVVSFLKDQTLPPDERGFLWTHIIDPVLYRGTTSVRDEVQSVVLEKVTDTINEHVATHGKGDISFMGYSLGTIVAHDVLHRLGTGQASEDGKIWTADKFNFANVFLVANATRLGPPPLIKFKAYDSVVRPVSAGPSPGGFQPYAKFFYNFRNEWDPVASWQRFDPKKWGKGFYDVPVRHIHQLNVHGLQHYLDHPEVHVRLFRALLGWFAVSDAEWHQRTADFPNLKPNACTDSIATLMNDLDELRSAVTGGKIDDVAMGLLGFYRAIKKAKAGCEELFNKVDGWL